MIYELFLEGELADIRQDLGMQLNFNIDDINKYGSRDTSFSKTIVLPGTAKNNKLLGFVGELGSFNAYINGAANIGSNFNPAQTTKAELRANGLLLLKGVFRLTGIVKDRDIIEYEGNLFGELGGFIAAIGREKLEELNFSEYNHNYTRNAIVGSWDNKIIKDIRVDFIVFAGVNIIAIQNGIDLKLKPNDQIIITNANVSGNNKTYTVTQYDSPTNTTNALIYVSQSITATNNDDITLEYTLSFGQGYYYPLIDHGRYSTDKKNYDYRTFRPALYVKEYIDKIFAPSGYTYESNFLNSSFFKKLIIPCNLSKVTKRTSDLLDAIRNTTQFLQQTDAETTNTTIVSYPTIIFANAISGNGNPNFTYTSSSVGVSINFKINVRIFPYISPPSTGIRTHRLIIELIKNNSIILFTQEYVRTHKTSFQSYNAIIDTNIATQFDTNDFFYIRLTYKAVGVYTNTETNSSYVVSSSLKITSTNPVVADIQLNDPIYLDELIPRNILQVDFFTWVVKMFNLYITEDKIKPNHLFIEPYKDYYDLTESVDWTYKVARDKPWQIKPMGMLNGRFFEYKFKTDNDYYNENFRKKFGMSYGDILYDTGFQFAKQKQTLEIGFSPTPLIEYEGTGIDKVVPAIYKLTKGNSVEQEEWIESNIRIMMVKKITGVNSWSIVNRGALLNQTPTAIGAALTAYGYAGHFDDPKNPTVDINFGAASEIYFDPNTYPSANLFNEYWSGYIAEIADKDSKLLTCHVYLTELDIAQLDFSKPVFIDGVLWRINKIMDFDASSGELTKVELLKVINNG